MKKYLLLISLLVPPLYAMDQDTIKVEETAPIDTSVLTLPLDTQIMVLRIIMLNRLQDGDYTSVTHVLEKTKLPPGDYFTGLFERGTILAKQISHKSGGIVYFLYKAAMEEGHKETIRLIQEEGCLVQAQIYARAVFHDDMVRFHLLENPHFKEQYYNYEDVTNASRNSLLIQKGREPLTKEEWEARYWRDHFRKWIFQGIDC